MLYRRTILSVLIIQICMLQTFSHTIDEKVFEIVLNDMNYDEQSENEMIRPEDLKHLKPLIEDENRYKPLHSHVKHYNEQNDKNKKQLSNVFPYLRHVKEIFNSEEENKPFIIGFKQELDKTITEITTTRDISIKTTRDAKRNQIRIDSDKRNVRKMKRSQNYRKNENGTKIVRIKREEAEYETTIDEEMDFFRLIRDRNVTTSKAKITEYIANNAQITRMQHDIMYKYSQNIRIRHDDTANDISRNQSLISEEDKHTPMDTESPDEEPYDYEKFKMEYEQQLEYNIKSGKVFNYTKIEEESAKDAFKKIVDLKRPKNCTEEELRQIGIKAIRCLIYDYQRTKNIASVRKLLLKMWIIVRVWLLIYICLAIPCWCYRGWCCCCFRCKFCFPRKRILLAKRYYMFNPPGILVKSLKEKDVEDFIKYEATQHEYDEYKAFEKVIRKL